MNTNNSVKLNGINIGITVTTKSQSGGVIFYSEDIQREKILNKEKSNEPLGILRPGILNIMNKYENNTRVTFDNNLKLCIMNIPSRIMSNLKSDNYETLQETQKQIREYLVNHQREFNIAGILKHSYECCPDFYALLSAVTSDLSKCYTWDDVYNQFFSSLSQTSTLYDSSNNTLSSDFRLCNYGDDVNANIKITCMCSHLCSPENISIITNRYTELNCLIACDCLEKTGIINSYNFKKKVKQNDAYAKILLEKIIEKQKKINQNLF